MLGVPSCDRTDVLARGLESYMQNSRDHGRDVEFVVVDDSRTAAARIGNRARLRTLRRRFGTTVRYGSRRERARYALALARESGVPVPLVRFALIGNDLPGISTGACRNALLLHAVDEAFVHVDDDTVCRVAQAPGARPGVAAVAARNVVEHTVCATAEEARARVTFATVDYFGLYQAALGRSACDLLSAASSDPALVESDFVRRLQARRSRVAVAMLGVVGDSGFGSTEMYLFLAEARSRGHVIGFPGGHRRAFESHQLIRATPLTTVMDGGVCMGIALGLDHRSLLPPFTPMLRNSDGIFANVRQACLPATAMAFLPWVVEHTPPVIRRSSFDAVLGGAGAVGLPSLLSWFIRGYDASGAGEEPADRMRALGRHLVALGREPIGEYRARCRQLLRARVATFVRYVETFEAACGEAPIEWRQDLAAYLASATRHVEGENGVAPRDLLAHGLSPRDAVTRGQTFVAAYGELLEAWPTLVAAARRLRQRELRAVPLLQS
jgi:hypothetical protein